jgi:anti-sigma factor RsiW
MPMDCEAVRDHLDAWALGALDADDARQVERHLETCNDCSALTGEAREAAASLTLAVPLQAASSALKARVMAGAAVLDDLPRSRAMPWRGWRYWPHAAAASFALVLGLGAWAAFLQSEVNDLRDDRASFSADATAQSVRFATVSTQLIGLSEQRREELLATDVITEIVSQEDVTRLAMSGTEDSPDATGRYVWSRTAGMGALVARDLPQLPEGKQYCLWVVYEHDWVVGGLFDVEADGSGRVIVRELEVDDAAGRLEGFVVTVEDEGPVANHTGAAVLEATIVREEQGAP